VPRKGPRKLVGPSRGSEAKRTQKARQRAPIGHNDWLSKLLNDDSPKYAKLRAQSEVELVDCVAQSSDGWTD
jgi:hypothetical protein